ncbi:MAG: hypothetical protein ACE5I2_05055 [Anaerolineae bacterium]
MTAEDTFIKDATGNIHPLTGQGSFAAGPGTGILGSTRSERQLENAVTMNVRYEADENYQVYTVDVSGAGVFIDTLIFVVPTDTQDLKLQLLDLPAVDMPVRLPTLTATPISTAPTPTPTTSPTVTPTSIWQTSFPTPMSVPPESTPEVQGLGLLKFEVPEGGPGPDFDLFEQDSGNRLTSVRGSFRDTKEFWIVPGTYRVVFDPEPYVGEIENVVIEPGEVTSLDLTQLLGSLKFEIPEGGPGPDFDLFEQDSGERLDSVRGSFGDTTEFWIVPGTYRIVFDPEPYVGEIENVVIKPGQATSLDLTQLLGLLKFEIPRGGPGPDFDLFDQDSGERLDSVRGSFEDTTEFWIVPGTYRIVFDPAPYVGEIDNVVLEPGQETSLDFPQLLGSLKFKIPEDGPGPDFDLFDQDSGEQLDSVRGSFGDTTEFWIVPGTYRIVFDPAPYVGEIENVIIKPGQETSLDFTQLLGSLKFEIPEGGPGPDFDLFDQDSGEQLDSVHGSFGDWKEFWVVPGTYRIVLHERQPYVGEIENVVIEPGREVSLDLTQPLGLLSFEVPQGESEPDFDIFKQDSGKQLAGIEGAQEGIRVVPGTYRIRLLGSYAGWVENVRIEPGEATSVDLKQRLGILRFDIPEDGEKPAFTLYEQDSGVRISDVGTDEARSEYWLMPGTYKIKFWLPYRGWAENISIEAGKETIIKTPLP